MRAKLNKFFPVNILGNLLSPAEVVRYLHVWFYLKASSCLVLLFFFFCHVKSTGKDCFFHIRGLKRHRRYLTCSAALLAVTAWLEANAVVLVTVIPCLVFLLLIFAGSRVSTTVLLEFFTIPLSAHISLLSEKLFTGYLSSIALFSIWPYWCTSSYKVVIRNTL